MLIIGSIYRVIYNNINLISDEILCWFRDKVSFFFYYDNLERILKMLINRKLTSHFIWPLKDLYSEYINPWATEVYYYYVPKKCVIV
jgi:hypothetical protein